MAYDSKDERSNNPGKVNRYSGVKEGPGIPMQPRKQSESAVASPPAAGMKRRYDKTISARETTLVTAD
jgi:hypothetical protein